MFLFSIWFWALLPCCLTILLWLCADLLICSVAFWQNIFHRLRWMAVTQIGKLFMEDTLCDTASHYCLSVLLIPQPRCVILYEKVFFCCRDSLIPWTWQSIRFSKPHFYKQLLKADTLGIAVAIIKPLLDDAGKQLNLSNNPTRLCSQKYLFHKDTYNISSPLHGAKYCHHPHRTRDGEGTYVPWPFILHTAK